MKNPAVLLVLIAASQMRAGDSTPHTVRQALAAGYRCGIAEWAKDILPLEDKRDRAEVDRQWIKYGCDEARKLFYEEVDAPSPGWKRP